MELGLTNSRVLVTGSSRGIGYGIASAFLAEGATVVLTGRNKENLQGARSTLADEFGGDRIEVFAGDLGDENIRQCLSGTLRPQGLDHLICNVGSGRSVPILQETTDEWRHMFDTNLFQATGMVQDFRSLLAASVKQGHGASLTFVGSICGMEAIGCPLAYASAKAALWAYAKNLVRPLADEGIRVNIVSPGNVMFSGSTWEDKLAQDTVGVQAMLDREVPMRRLGTLDEITAAVVFLASRRASFITGANLVVDGGQTRGL
ncbi:MAG: 3-oxoacyl-[acyl-carrier-protein] reductase FabG [Nitrosomonadaceae bacterium]|nr:3-oxoacyl-[acyl-carrier-protein] reductase FabG [Nitrosomonadaceae bacterium]